MRVVGVVTALSIGCVGAAPGLDRAAVPSGHVVPTRDAQVDAALLAGGLGDAIAAESPAACAVHNDAAAHALAEIEPSVLVAIEDASALRSLEDGASETERSLRAWLAYDAAVDVARARVAAEIHDDLAATIMRRPAVNVVATEAALKVYGASDSVPLELIEHARTRARLLAGAELQQASVACAAVTIDSARPRWVSVFNRKT